MDKVRSLTIEKEKGDKPMGRGEKKGLMQSETVYAVWERIPRKFYLTFGSEQETSVVLS